MVDTQSYAVSIVPEKVSLLGGGGEGGDLSKDLSIQGMDKLTFSNGKSTFLWTDDLSQVWKSQPL